MTKLRGLYAVTPDVDATDELLSAVAAAAAGGCRVVQYRHKTANAVLRRTQAAALAGLCRNAGIRLIINDDLELALVVGADGVHLGGDDGGLREARIRLGPQRILGASCYADLERARQAVMAGADYVAFGAVFPSSTKPGAQRASLELLRQARRELDCPIAAIGGISTDNAPSVISAGADMVAVISDLFESPDISARARQFQSFFSTSGEEST